MLPASRILAATTTLTVLAGALVLLGAAPSQAAASSAISDGSLRLTTSSELDTPASDPCTATEPHSAEVVRVLTDGSQGLTTSEAGAYANGSNVADTVRTAGSARASATSSIKGDVRRVDVVADLSATNEAALSSSTACDVEVDTGMRLAFDLDVTRPGFVTLGGTGSRAGTLSISVFNDDTNLFLDLVRNPGRTTNRLFVSPGQYLVTFRAAVARDRDIAGTPAEPVTRSGRLAGFLQFNPSGTATGPTVGPGARSVFLPPTLACGSRSITLGWRRPAARAKVATIRVDGRVVRKVRNPTPGKAVVLRRLPAYSPVTVSVTVGTRTARRTYEACGALG